MSKKEEIIGDNIDKKYMGQAKKSVNSLINFFIIFCFLLIFGMLSTVSFWLFYPYKPLVIKNIEILTVPELGKKFEYKITYVKNTNLPAVVTKQFVNNHIVLLPPQLSNVNQTKKGEVDIKIDSFMLDNLVPDKYYFKWTAMYQVNPIRTIQVSVQTKCFTIK